MAKRERVVVTGGAGFIGSHIVDGLLEQGFEVVVLDNLFTGKKEFIKHNLKRITFIKGDIRNKKDAEKALKGADYVLHEAAMRSVPASLGVPHEYNDINIDGTVTLLDAARKLDIKRLVFASSSSVYGDCEVLPQRETMLPDPRSPYAITKAAGEYYLRTYYKLYGLGTVSLRYFNVFGPRQDPNSQYSAVIPLFMKAIKANKSPVIFGDGEQTRDFTFVKNIVEANILAMQCKKAEGEVMNIANGEGVTVNQLVEKINRILGKNVKAKHVAERAGDVKHTLADNSKAMDILGYKGSVGFDGGLKITIEWFNKN